MRAFWAAARISLIGLLAALAILYAGDYLYARLRLARNTPGDPIDSITFQPTYVIAQKDGRADIEVGPLQTQQCVHSIFPHFGFTPCWRLKQTSQQPQVIGGTILFSRIFSGPVHSPRLGKNPACIAA